MVEEKRAARAESHQPVVEAKHAEITQAIIGAFYAVYNELGYGFAEKVYENALALELAKSGHTVQQQAPLRVHYSGQVVGEFFADLLVDDAVIAELKAVTMLTKAHEAQLLNYLKATRMEVGLLLNFGPKAEVKRRILDNARKGSLSWAR